MNIPNKEFYEDAYDKLAERHFKGCGAYEEYMLFSRFIYGLFIRNEDLVITRENFRDMNLEVAKRIRRQVEKHPKLFRRFFMVK